MLYYDSLKYEAVANIISNNIGERKLVLLQDNESIRKLLLEKYSIEKIEIINWNRDELCRGGTRFYKLLNLASRADEYFICNMLPQYDIELKKEIENLGYKEFQDYVFAYHKRLVLPPGTRDYSDEYGNNIISTGNFQVTLAPLAGNCFVNIDDSTSVGNNSNIVMGECNGIIKIGKKCKFDYNAHLELFLDAKIEIHEKSTFTGNFKARATGGSIISIGKDCMFSNDVEVYVGDGHSIFSIEARERTNECYPHNTKNEILIGNHVWVGLRSIILGCRIGNNSIIGAGAVIKGDIPESCVVVGNPGVIKRRGVTWSRDNYTRDIGTCREDFEIINL